MKSIGYLIGSSLAGATLYLSQQTGILFLVGWLVIAFIGYLIQTAPHAWIRFLCVNLFFIAYMLPTFWCLSYIAPNESSIGLVLILIPYAIYIIPMITLLFLKYYIVEFFFVSWLWSEWFFTWIEIGNPFLQIGTILSYFPILIQWYQYTGPLGGSLWFLALGYILYRVICLRDIHYGYLVIILFPIVCSLLIEHKGNTKNTMRKVGIVTLDTNNTKIDSILFSHSSDTYIDYILCPEAIWDFQARSFDTHPRITAIRRTLTDSLKHATIILGIFIDSPSTGLQNAVVTYARDNPSQIRYKQRYIPFGEYIPYPAFLGRFSFLRNYLIYDISLHKNETELCIIHEDSLAPLICYEGILIHELSERCNLGAEIFFISASNIRINSIYIEKLIRNLSIANAISLHRSIVRATSNGLSYAINSCGQVIIITDRKNTWITSNVPLETIRTFYNQHNTKLTILYGSIYFILSLILIIYNLKREILNLQH